ncbi:unnamed protein product [Brugia timori]|uniref:Nodule Cysteine-Rich (NCR) secreted peptide n=1 Tax=Brugia timori TaxID=42155 RepID=A0A0R3RC26_9BILA|nr:unnamed protein product [Brugia timori]
MKRGSTSSVLFSKYLLNCNIDDSACFDVLNCKPKTFASCIRDACKMHNALAALLILLLVHIQSDVNPKIHCLVKYCMERRSYNGYLDLVIVQFKFLCAEQKFHLLEMSMIVLIWRK